MAKILVVDDDPATVTLMRDWLKLRKYEVLTANNGTDALQIAESQHPDIILLDVMMPDIDGIETCKRLRAGERTSRIPVILITAHGPAVGRFEGLMAGATDYITKPVALNDLEARLHALLTHAGISLDQSEHLLNEIVHATLAILPCNLAWLLTIDSRRRVLVSRAVAASQGEHAKEQFVRTLSPGGGEILIPFEPKRGLLVRTALGGIANFNLPLSRLHEMGEKDVYRACENLNLYFATILPLQMAGTPLGCLLLGSLEPRDVETTRGQQLFSVIASQASMVVSNANLMQRLAEQEAESSHERAFRQMLLDTMGDGLLVCNSKGQIRYTNRRLSRMTGRPTQTLRARHVEDLFHPEDRERLQAIFSQARPIRTSSFEARLLRADGEYMPVLAVQAGSPPSAEGQESDERIIVVADLSEQKRREQALAKQTQRLVALNRASEAITSTLSLDQVLSNILSEARRALNATAAVALLHVQREGVLTFHSAVGLDTSKLAGLRLSVKQGVAGYAVREKRSVLVEDTAEDARFKGEIDVLTGIQSRSIAVVPLLVQGEVAGVLEVMDERKAAFNKSDIEILEGLARSASIAIGNARLFSETQRRIRELTLLLKTSEAASRTLAIEKALETAAWQIMDALAVKWCLISFWDRQTDMLVQLAEVADLSWPEEESRHFTLDDQYPLSRRAVEEGKPFSLSVGELEQEPGRRDTLLKSGFQTLQVIPITIEGKTVGLAELYFIAERDPFSAADLNRCQTAIQAWYRILASKQSWTEQASLRQLGARLIHASDASWCSILLYNPEQKVLRVQHEGGTAIWPFDKGQSYPLNGTSLRRVALIERNAIAARLEDTTLSPADHAAFWRAGKGSMLIAPLMARGEALGLMQLIDTKPGRSFSEGDLSLAQAIGNLIGGALENARLYSALSRRAAQLEAAYNDLREADRTKDEFIQNVSHELRTPLTTIIGYAELMLNQDFGPLTDEQKEGLNVILDKSRQLTQLVEGILAIQEMEREPLRRSLCSIREIAKQAIESVRPLAEAASIQIVTSFPSTLPSVQVDRQRMVQVLENLLTNAIKFSTKGGQVTVAIRDTRLAVQVEVSDQGIGIPAEEHDKIWRRFYQVDGSMTRQYGGAGIGLSIVKHVIEKHGGRVWVESEPGKGSTFAFIIPKSEVIEADTKGTSDAADSTPEEKE
jgi:PAS domain S-box-containing protein